MNKRRLATLVLWTAGLSLGAQDRGLALIAKDVTGSPEFNVGTQYAVIIGIDRYQEWPSLKSAVSEARRVREVLAERYFIDEFIELYDQSATASNIRRLFAEELPRKVGIDDSLFVFYAGHGYLDASQTGFWIASDGVRDVYDQKGWLPNAQLRNFVSQLKAQRILVVADACFSGDFLNVSRGAMPTVDSAYFKRALQLTSRQILTSGASETVPDESEFGRQFINLLVRNVEPLLDPISMYDRIRRGVTQTEPLLGSIPGHEQGASFVLFLKPAGPGTAPTAAQAAVPVPASSQSASIRTPAQGRAALRVRPAESQRDTVEVVVKTAGVEGAAPRPLTVETYIESGAWVVEARLRGDIEPTFRREIQLLDGSALTIDLPTLQFSKPFQLRNLQSEFDLLSHRLSKAEAARKTKRSLGWIGLGIGVVGLGTAAYSYIDGIAAHEAYSAATLTQEARDAWARVSLDGTLLSVSGPVAGLSLTVAPLLLFTSPIPGIERKMEGIRGKIELLDE